LLREGRKRGGPHDKTKEFQSARPDLQLTETEWLPINSAIADPAGRRRGVFAWLQSPVNPSDSQGGVPEWLKGTGCKPVGYAYVGSNPTPSTTTPMSRMDAGVAQW
jgi:hypothetical protein